MTHGFVDDERQQVVEERSELLCRNAGDQQGDPLSGELLQHGVVLRLQQEAE